MDVPNEIVNELGVTRREPRLSAPSLLVALGDFGASCLDGLSACLTAENASDRLVGRFGVAGADENHQGLSVGVVDETIRLELPAQSSRYALSRWLRSEAATVRSLFVKEGGALLDRASQMGRTANRLDIYLFGDAEQFEGSVGGIELAGMAREALTGYLANLRLRIYGVFLLPQGIGQRDAEVFAFLTDLFAIQRRPGWREGAFDAGLPYDRAFLVSPANSFGPLDKLAVRDLVVEFLLLSLFADLQSVAAQTLDDRQATFVSYGLATLLHPVDQAATSKARQFATALIDEVLLAPDDGSGGRQAEEYVKNQRLDVGTLYDRLIAADRGTLVERVRVDPLVFRETPMSMWPDRIASYDAFLEAEITQRQASAMDANADLLLAEIEEQLRRRVDEIIGGGASIETAAGFLAKLRELLLETRQKALARMEASLRTAPRLRETHNRLAHEIQHLPGVPAVAGRFFAGGALLFFLVRVSLALLRQLPDRYVNQAYLPSARLTGWLVIAAAVAGAWLTYKRAEARLWRWRQRYGQAVEQRHRQVLEHHALECLVRSPMPETAAAELASVRRFKRDLITARGSVGESPVFSGSKIRRDAGEALAGDVNYNRGQYRMAEEAAVFASGGLSGWRELDAGQLAERLVAFSRRGFQFVERQTVANLLMESSASEQTIDHLLRALRQVSRPYLALLPEPSNLLELMFLDGWPEVAMTSGADLARVTVFPSHNPYRLSYLQFGYPVSLESLAALPYWRRAYERQADKMALHCSGLGHGSYGAAGGA